MPDSPTPEPETDFVCDCDEQFRSACAGEAFYRQHEGKRYCLLHLPCTDKTPDFGNAVKQKLDANDFNFRGVWFPSSTSFQDCNFRGDADFTKTVFNDLVDFRRSVFTAGLKFDDAVFKARATFNQVVFEGFTSFQGTRFLGYTSFGRAKFIDQVSFLAAEFSEGANFLHTLFIKDVGFHGSKLGGVAFFRAAKFSNSVDFEFAKFREANFVDTNFGGDSDFSECIFESEADYFGTMFVGSVNFCFVTFKARSNFKNTRFGGSATFDRSRFCDDVYFVNAKFEGYASFNETTFNSAASFDLTSFESKVDFTYARFNELCRFVGDEEVEVFGTDSTLNLQHCRIEKPSHLSFHTLTLRPHWFINVDARKVEFTNVDWHWAKIGHEFERLTRTGVPSPFRLLAIASRQLAVNAEENHRYEEASKFRYMAMEARRLESWRGFAPWRLSWWYWLASGYGERVWQAFFVLLGILLLSALFYNHVGFARWEAKVASESDVAIAKRDDVGAPLKFSRALTYSAGVMTLQKPEPRPATTAAQTVVLLETVLGPVQAALLALAIRRKFMR